MNLSEGMIRMRFKWLRFNLRVFMAGIVGLALVMAGANWAVKRWFAERVYPTYVRPLGAMDDRTRELFELMGANAVGFEYCVPKDRTVTITLVARNEKGPIPEASQVHILNEGPGAREVHFLRLDPDKLQETKKNRVRWALQVGSNTTWLPWIDNPEPVGSPRGTMQSMVPQLDNPQLGKSYKIWEYQVSVGPNRNTGRPPGPGTRVFSVELRFQVDKAQPNSMSGWHQTGPYVEKAEKAQGAGPSESQPKTSHPGPPEPAKCLDIPLTRSEATEELWASLGRNQAQARLRLTAWGTRRISPAPASPPAGLPGQ